MNVQFAQITYSNGKVWNAHYRNIEDAKNYADIYSKLWNLTYSITVKNFNNVPK